MQCLCNSLRLSRFVIQVVNGSIEALCVWQGVFHEGHNKQLDIGGYPD